MNNDTAVKTETAKTEAKPAPLKPAETKANGELSDDDLDQVAGGQPCGHGSRG